MHIDIRKTKKKLKHNTATYPQSKFNCDYKR